MTKKHFKAYAESIGKEFYADSPMRSRITELFGGVALSFNPRFDWRKFERAVDSAAAAQRLALHFQFIER